MLKLRERLPHRARDDKVCTKSAVKRRLIDDDKLVSAIVAHKPRRGIDRERRARDDELSLIHIFEMALIVETPQARPSSPSIRLTAFVMPTIHSTVMGIASQPLSLIHI